MKTLELNARSQCYGCRWSMASDSPNDMSYHAIHRGLRSAAKAVLKANASVKYTDMEIAFCRNTMFALGDTPEIYSYSRFYPQVPRGEMNFPTNLYGLDVVIDEGVEEGTAELRHKESKEVLCRIEEVA